MKIRIWGGKRHDGCEHIEYEVCGFENIDKDDKPYVAMIMSMGMEIGGVRDGTPCTAVIPGVGFEVLYENSFCITGADRIFELMVWSNE